MIKQVIVFRADLNMRKGKIAAQVAHGALTSFLKMTVREEQQEIATQWYEHDQVKIVLSVANEELLLKVKQLCDERGIPCALITDLGHTEFHGVPTNTVVAIGPWDSNQIDTITGPQGLVPTKLA